MSTGIFDPSKGGKDLGGMIDPLGGTFKSLTGSSAIRRLVDPAGVIPGEPVDPAIAARKAEAEAQKRIEDQRKKEAARLAENESEVAKRKAAGRSGRSGRSLLIKTSQQGLAQNLGGTQ